MTDWIAHRALRSSTSDNEIIVRLGRPVGDSTGVWSCEVQVTALELPEVTVAHGEDSLQALLLGISMLRARVLSLQRKHKLTWLDGEDIAIELEPRESK